MTQTGRLLILGFVLSAVTNQLAFASHKEADQARRDLYNLMQARAERDFNGYPFGDGCRNLAYYGIWALIGMPAPKPDTKKPEDKGTL